MDGTRAAALGAPAILARAPGKQAGADEPDARDDVREPGVGALSEKPNTNGDTAGTAPASTSMRQVHGQRQEVREAELPVGDEALPDGQRADEAAALLRLSDQSLVRGRAPGCAANGPYAQL